ncbi:MAG: cysteine desulfurase [Alphaproteobacteria bacterium]|nr:MAG: cysteine desulfurase [Alphaproteobacteria bacterium]
MQPLTSSVSKTVYLDHNATTPLRPEVREAMANAFDCFGNPSSVHRFGRAARALVEDAREAVASLINADPSEILFTSGGTEAAAVALHQLPADALPLASRIEHPAVRDNFPPERQAAVTWLPAGADGAIDLDRLADVLANDTSSRPVFLALMLANNESGVIQPVVAARTMLEESGRHHLIFTDAVQAVGKIPVDVRTLGIDYLSLSAHKIGGPKGVGALYVRADAPFRSLWRGGGQERRMRPGTENVLGIVGLGAAARAVVAQQAQESRRLARLREKMEKALKAIRPDLVILGERAPRVPNTTLFAVPGTKAEVLVMRFDLAGIAVSTGAACSSGRTEPSHVVAAMTDDPAIREAAVRVSLGWSTTEEDITRFLAVAGDILVPSRATSPALP